MLFDTGKHKLFFGLSYIFYGVAISYVANLPGIGSSYEKLLMAFIQIVILSSLPAISLLFTSRLNSTFFKKGWEIVAILLVLFSILIIFLTAMGHYKNLNYYKESTKTLNDQEKDTLVSDLNRNEANFQNIIALTIIVFSIIMSITTFLLAYSQSKKDTAFVLFESFLIYFAQILILLFVFGGSNLS